MAPPAFTFPHPHGLPPPQQQQQQQQQAYSRQPNYMANPVAVHQMHAAQQQQVQAAAMGGGYAGVPMHYGNAPFGHNPR